MSTARPISVALVEDDPILRQALAHAVQSDEALRLTGSYADAETLFFEHTRTPEGYYFKDHRSSPEREYEFIEFETPVNVWQVDARVNYYEGNTPGGPSGEVRIEFDGKIYSGRFSLAASHGNQGRSGGRQRDFWAKINVPEILKLQKDTAQAAESR
jgi:hypothetical protein